MGLYADLPDGRSALYVDLPHGRSALVAGTFWNWFQPIPIEVHPLHVMIWAGEASIGLQFDLSRSISAYKRHRIPLLQGDTKEKGE